MKEQALARMNSLSGDFETNYLMDNGDHKIIATAVMKDSPKILQRDNSAFSEISLWNFSKLKTISGKPSESSNEWTGIKVDLSKVYQRSVIKKAKINIKQNSDKTIEIYELNPEGNVVGQKIGEFENEVELVSLVLQNRGDPVYLALPETIAAEEVSLDVEYKPSDELLKGQQYFSVFQEKLLSCKVDVISGAPYLECSLLNFGGERFPLSLKLVYDFLNKKNALNLDSGCGEGFYTNFNQICYDEMIEQNGISEEIYNWIDSNRIKHVFRRALHSETIWVDTQGTGLMLENEDGIKIYDEDGNFILFDFKGRLTEISLHRGKDEDFKNKIQYLNDKTGEIASITDGMGRTVSFDYGNNAVSIYFDQELKVIFSYGGSTPQLTYMSDGNEFLGYKFEFSDTFVKLMPSYNQYKSVVTLELEGNKVKSTQGLERNFSFAYESNLTKISTYNGSVGESDNVMTWAYGYNDREEIINTYEIKHENDYSTNYTNRNKLEYGSGSISEKKLVQFQNQKLTDAGTKSETLQDSDLSMGDFYVFSAAFSFEGTRSATEDAPKIELIDEDNKVLSTLTFNTQNNSLQFGSDIFRLPGKSLRIICTTKGKGNFFFVNITVTPIEGTFQIIAVNQDVGDGYIQCDGGRDEKYFYLKDNEKVRVVYADNSSSTVEAHLYANDYFANERNFQTSENGVWNLWYDNRRKMIADVKEAEIIGDNSSLFTLGKSNNIKFTLLSLEKHIMNAISQSHASEDQEKFEQNGKEVTSYMRKSNSSYTRETPAEATCHYEELSFFNDVQNVLQTRDPQKKTDNNYTYEGYLASTRVQSLEKFEDNIEEWWGYLYNYLTSTHSYYLDHEIITEMSYDKMGNMIKSVNPQKLEKNIEYNNFGIDITKVSAIINEDENSNELQYNNEGQLIALINDQKTNYQFQYDNFNRLTSVQVNREGYAKISYSSDAQFNTTTINYENGQTVERTFDPYGHLVRVESIDAEGQSAGCNFYYGDEQDPSYLPDMNKVYSNSKLKRVYDYFADSNVDYDYNDYGNLSSIREWRKDIYDEFFYYDDRQRLSSYLFNVERKKEFVKTYYEYKTGNNADQNVVKITQNEMGSNYNLAPSAVDARLSHITSWDSLGRVDKEDSVLAIYPDPQNNVNLHSTNYMTKYYSYAPRTVEPGMGSGTTNFIEQENIFLSGDIRLWREIKYTYDLNGNITSITRDGKTITYSYDSANRLLSEKNPFFKKRYSYVYDSSGNITNKLTSDYPLHSGPIDVDYYQYDEKFPDRLIKLGSNKFEYDECGNPTLYKGIKIEWMRGRLLKNYFYEENRNINFVYDANGVMVNKYNFMYGTTNLGERVYYYRNGRLLAEGIRKMDTLPETEYDYIYYFYNQSGIAGFRWNDVVYYYVKDFRGDILEIRKASDNSLVASYEYDAWGNHIVYDADGNENADPDFIGNFNPFRYRGYYYDTDLKMYYLITRWYDPEIGRFINMDQISYLDPETVNGLNLYVYCLNNPVMGYDPMGTNWWEDFKEFSENLWNDIKELVSDIWLEQKRETEVAYEKISNIIKEVGQGIEGIFKGFKSLFVHPKIGLTNYSGSFQSVLYRGIFTTFINVGGLMVDSFRGGIMEIPNGLMALRDFLKKPYVSDLVAFASFVEGIKSGNKLLTIISLIIWMGTRGLY